MKGRQFDPREEFYRQRFTKFALDDFRPLDPKLEKIFAEHEAKFQSLADAARSRATDPAATRVEPTAILGLRRCTARAARRT